MRVHLLNLVLLLVTSMVAASPLTFVNPVYEGADPWIIKHDGTYYACQTKADEGVIIWKSDSLTDKGIPKVVWQPEKDAWNRGQVWAPELHLVRGKWYIYYAASDGHNENHRMGVLEALTDDPQGEYVDHGALYTGDGNGAPNRWAIDGTVLDLNDQLYFIWSGWEDERDIQYLYIAPMENPHSITAGRVRIAGNADYIWERVNNDANERGLAEGPQIIERNSRIFILYSTSASWLPSYKLGLIELENKDKPLETASWKKLDRPVFQGSEQMLGVGHACFVKSPDDSEDWIVYHSKISPQPGWLRAVWMQKFHWGLDGLPYFGEPVPRGVMLEKPSGEKPLADGREFTDDFGSNDWNKFAYFGYSLFIFAREGELHIGGRPNAPVVNDYRSGEKALVRGMQWSDATVSAKVRVRENGTAGVVMRVQYPHVGENGFTGYYAGIDPANDRVVLQKCDGTALTEIGSAEKELDAKKTYGLALTAVGDKITVSCEGEELISVTDADYESGMAGVRVSEAHGIFDDVTVSAK